jgi:2-methylcitrate dehydratase PrpD
MNEALGSDTTAISRFVAEEVVGLHYAALPEDVCEIARQCLLDYLGVTLAGADEPAAQLVLEDVLAEGGRPLATIIGGDVRVAKYQAALVNGTAGHALDYDDAAPALTGHPGVVLFPALLALGEERAATGEQILEAFVAGYEAGSRIGLLLAPSHYDTGFHGTGTIGTFAAAAGCAKLLGLDADRTMQALGLAATQAAGLKAVFGTMAKPLHAGKAACNGLLSAMLASRGFESCPHALEAPQGFAASHSNDFNVRAATDNPLGQHHLRENLFKYHAACFGTHGTIEAILRMKERFRFGGHEVARVVVRCPAMLDKTCNIKRPRTGLEGKFSLTLTAAFALAGVDTSRIDSFTDEAVHDPVVTGLRDKVEIEFTGDEKSIAKSGWAEVMIHLSNGRQLFSQFDSCGTEPDLQLQRRRLEAKFKGLAEPVVGEPAAKRIVALSASLEDQASIDELMKICRRAQGTNARDFGEDEENKR